jgi:SH3-like domain-containing protein
MLRASIISGVHAARGQAPSRTPRIFVTVAKTPLRALFILGTFCLASAGAAAADFRSIAEGGTVMYDAPSSKAKKLYVASRDYPVEVVVNDGTWVKVRDATGELVWIEKKALSERRMVLVTVSLADVRQAPSEQAGLAFRAQQGVVFELSELGSGGWAKVRHRDGRSGYVRINQLWGL